MQQFYGTQAIYPCLALVINRIHNIRTNKVLSDTLHWCSVTIDTTGRHLRYGSRLYCMHDKPTQIDVHSIPSGSGCWLVVLFSFPPDMAM